MKELLAFLKECGGRAVVCAIGKVADAAKAVVEYLKSLRYSKHAKELRKAETQLDKACDSGDLSDLINAAEKLGKIKKTVAILACAMICAGCESITVNTVKPYEGRYDSKEKLIDALKGVDLKRGESIWLLTPDTLKRLLKNTEG